MHLSKTSEAYSNMGKIKVLHILLKALLDSVYFNVLIMLMLLNPKRLRSFFGQTGYCR